MIYTYKCKHHGIFEQEHKQGEAPFEAECGCGKICAKVILFGMRGETTNFI